MSIDMRQLLIWAVIAALIITLSQCSGSKDKDVVNGNKYAGRQTCVKCHKDINEQYSLSAHFHTSAPFSNDILKAALRHNDQIYFNESLKVVIEERNDEIYQVAYSANKEVNAKRFDVSFGSGEKARTFAYWEDTGLYQLPLTYYAKINSWINSPGFPSDHVDYKRAIIGRCLECHSSFAQTKTVKTGSLSVTEEVVKGSVAYGIDCQRCHGPAAEHVAFHEDNPGGKVAKYIVKIRDLSRQQKIDQCAVCHSGNNQTPQKSTFGFLPGDTLADYYYPYSNIATELDVHGNQSQMLASSACYIKSDMDCSSCHNTHITEKNNAALFAQRCMNCHIADTHPLASKLGAVSLTKNCIDCHMPVKPSRLITFQLAGKTQRTPYLLRSHQIAVYPDETQKILSYLKSK